MRIDSWLEDSFDDCACAHLLKDLTPFGEGRNPVEYWIEIDFAAG
jgi:hypothetical protein